MSIDPNLLSLIQTNGNLNPTAILALASNAITPIQSTAPPLSMAPPPTPNELTNFINTLLGAQQTIQETSNDQASKLFMLDMIYATNGPKPIEPNPKCEILSDIQVKQEVSPNHYLLLTGSDSSPIPDIILTNEYKPNNSGLLAIKHQVPTCNVCRYPIIEPITAYVEEKPYHINCVRCASCELPMGFEQTCFMKDGQLLCRNDYAKKFRKKCAKCDGTITQDDIVMKVRDAVFHHSCFSCYICNATLNKGDLFTMSAQKHLFCHSHYEVVCNTVLREEAPPAASAQRDNSEEPEETEEEGMNHARSKRMRTSFKHHQLRTMKQYFNLNHNPDAKDLKQLAQKTGLTKRVLQVWFQNARAKYRRSMQNREGGNISPGIPQPLSIIDNASQISSASSQSSDYTSNVATPPENSSEYYEQPTLVSL
ncbi:unnamed protein product [Caenorhabditis bovis]|uniref:Uncharacterized protein n=1 Tax=Caenorhabditis bovis TaxID=2654633 RepID=A0A8S1EPA0_9PELO|nr:unnamed protein product [Caenorhabditis bovis]